MNQKDCEQLAVLLLQLRILPSQGNLDDLGLDSSGKRINTFDLYEKALTGYSIERIRSACESLVKVEQWFPVPATIILYMPEWKPPNVKALPEPEQTEDDKRRNILCRRYMYLCFNNKENGSNEGQEAFIKKHWGDDLSKPVKRGTGFSRIGTRSKVVYLDKMKVLIGQYETQCVAGGVKPDSSGEAIFINERMDQIIKACDDKNIIAQMKETIKALEEELAGKSRRK